MDNARIVVLDGGLHHRQAFTHIEGLDFLPVYEAESADLAQYDAIIIPFHTDQNVLSRMHKSLVRYVKDSFGVLVILGATEYGIRWLPFNHWKSHHPADVTKLERASRDGAIIFRDITSDQDLEFNTTFVAHGYLQSGNEWEVLATASDGPIMAVKRKGLTGTVFCTTLDPDYHTVADVPGRPGKEPERVYSVTGRLLSNIMDWVRLEIATRARSVWREERGFRGQPPTASSERPAQSTTINYNLNGSGARVNINSTDSSVNVRRVEIGSVFTQIRGAVSQIPEYGDRIEIGKAVDEMEKAVGSNMFLQKYQAFIASAANHMTVLAPVIPMLTGLLA